jgi:rubrerythrin
MEGKGMGVNFNADEILAMAEQIERNGANFYRKAAASAKAKDAAAKLKELAAMEENHEKIFAAMRSRLSEKQKGGTPFDPYGEAQAYLKAFADGHVFDIKADPAATLTGKESLAKILRKAIGLEKDSVVFYVGLKNLVPADLGREKVEEIIAEEMKHIAILSMELLAAGTR